MFLSKMWLSATIEELSSILSFVFGSVNFSLPFLLSGEHYGHDGSVCEMKSQAASLTLLQKQPKLLPGLHIHMHV